MRPPPAMMPPPRMGAATPPGPAVMAPPTAQMSQMRVGAGGPPPIASTPAAGMTPLVPQPGAPVVGPTGVAVSNFNQMVPPGGPPRPTGPTAPPPGPPPGGPPIPPAIGRGPPTMKPPPAMNAHPGAVADGGYPSPAAPPPPTMHPQRTANGAVGPPPRTVGGYPTYPGQIPPSTNGMVPPPGAPAANQPAIQPRQQSSGGGQRIDPAQIPRPAHDPHAEPIRWDSRTQHGAAAHPPAASTSFIAVDRGCCNPRYMRSTMSTIPHTGELLASSGMPLSIMVQPLAIPSPEEDPIQVVDNGDQGPLRCSRCKAYMNPFARWLDHGRFQCNFCQATSECPREYMCNLGADGKRMDWQQRPELCRGSVEYAAPAEYMVRPPMAPALFFCVDVSLAAVQSGATTSAVEAIARTLDAVPEPARTLVGICTYDTVIHFYHVHEEMARPRMLVVPDADEPYSPLPAGMAVPLERNREAIDAVLKQIPEMFANNRHGAPVGTAAVKACVEALKPVGGRVLAFMGTQPTGGLGKLSNRAAQAPNVGAKEAEKEPLRYLAPADKIYTKLATEAAEYQVAIDVFLLAPAQYVDVASLGTLPRISGGTLYRYPGFNTQLDFAQLHNDLRWNVQRPQGLEAVMRVRASNGLGVADYGGFYCKRTPTDVDLPALDCDKAIACNLRYEERLNDGGEAYVQCALLYTTVRGERRIRVHTMAMPITSVLGNVFRAADLEAQTCDMIRKVSARLLGGSASIQNVKDQTITTTVNTLYAYRKFCASNNSTGQLILPEGLKVLPLYCLGLHKSPGMRADAHADDRAAWLLNGLCSPVKMCVPSVYPRNFPVHRLVDECAAEGTEFPPLPPVTWLSAEKLEQDGIYVLEDAREMLVWVGRQVPDAVLRETFGVDHVDHIQSNAAALKQLDTPRSKSLNAFVNCMRRMRSGYLRTRILRRGDPAEAHFYAKLTEDRNIAGMSYVDFLCHVHRLIQNKFQ